jgi:hypothetical protein
MDKKDSANRDENFGNDDHEFARPYMLRSGNNNNSKNSKTGHIRSHTGSSSSSSSALDSRTSRSDDSRAKGADTLSSSPKSGNQTEGDSFLSKDTHKTPETPECEWCNNIHNNLSECYYFQKPCSICTRNHITFECMIPHKGINILF